MAALGLANYLVGRSHECDYPSSVASLPICTEPKFNPEGTSAEIHDRVTGLLQSALSVYRVKTEVLEQLQPTHILTDGNQYFNRPGSRLVDSLEILAEILHPDCFKFGYESSGWRIF